MSESRRGSKNGFYGKKHSEEFIEKRKKELAGKKLPKQAYVTNSKRLKGKPQSLELIQKRAESKKRPIIAKCKYTGYEIYFNSAADAAILGFNQSGISNVLSGRRKEYYDFYWRRASYRC